MKSIRKNLALAALFTLILTVTGCKAKDDFDGRWISGEGVTLEFDSAKKGLKMYQGNESLEGNYELSMWNSILITIGRYEYLGVDGSENWKDEKDTFFCDVKLDSDGNLLVANFSNDRLLFVTDTPSKEINGTYTYTDEYEKLTLTFNKEEGTMSFVEILTDEEEKKTYQEYNPDFNDDGIVQVIEGSYIFEEKELISLNIKYMDTEMNQDLDYVFADDKSMVTIGGLNFFKDDGTNAQVSTDAEVEGPELDSSDYSISEEELQELLDQAAASDESVTDEAE